MVAAGFGDLRGGEPAQNAEVVSRVLAGEGGPVRDIVLLNAAAALVAYAGPAGAAELESQLSDALRTAAKAVDSGEASALLSRWVAATGSLS